MEKKKNTSSNTLPSKKRLINSENWYYLLALSIVFVFIFSYIFNKKLDLNGDNACYYTYAKSISKTFEYRDLSVKGEPLTNNYPPGYPSLMAGLMLFSDSIISQKIMNGIFLLISILLLFFIVEKEIKSRNLALAACLTVIVNPSILSFSTMMMSEMSYLFFSILAFYCLTCVDKKKPFYKDKYFFLTLFFSYYAVFTRTQGISLIAGFFIYFLFEKKWLHSAAYIAGYFILSLPWTFRNKITGIVQNRYLEQITLKNHWRPDEGEATFIDLVKRGLETLKMLISEIIPSELLPFKTIDSTNPDITLNFIIGIAIISLIFIGFWQFKKYKSFLIAYTVITVGIICSWSAPGGGRYLVTLYPLFSIGLIIGLYVAICKFFDITGWKIKLSPLLMILLCFLASENLQKLHLQNKQKFPPNYFNYFQIAKNVKADKSLHDKVFCVRKPSLFSFYSDGYTTSYKYTENRAELIKGLIETDVDYVVLEQLGYSSTGLYLYPAIQNNQELFPLVYALPNPDTYLLKFDKEKAKEKLANNEIR